MKNKPQQMPNYSIKYNEKIKEWQLKKKFRYKDLNGKVHRTETKWHLSISDCEREVEEVSNAGGKSNLRSITIANTLNDYVDKLKLEANKKSDYKNSTSITYHKNASALLNNYTPKNIGDIVVAKADVSDFINWIEYINSDTSGHKALSGNRVRSLRSIMLKYIKEFLILNSYIQRDKGLMIAYSIDDYKIKKKKIGARNNRNQISFEDLQTIKQYYTDKGLENFENFYWYCLYIVLFCTGMRVGELLALQWRDIHFSPNDAENIIYISNSINEKEKVENVLKRIEKNNREAKNQSSIRAITMWDYYRGLFKDYKISYLNHFEIKNFKEMDNMFVFPNLRESERPYRNQKSLLKHTDLLMQRIGLPKTDNQMFRHSCAYFLAYVLDYTIDDTYDYFGHCDSEMIKQVYAPLNVEEKRKKVAQAQQSLISNHQIEFKDVGKGKKDIMYSKENKKHAIQSRQNREIKQIEKAIKKGRKTYSYVSDEMYKLIIDRIKKEHPEFEKQIKFVSIGSIYQ